MRDSRYDEDRPRRQAEWGGSVKNIRRKPLDLKALRLSPEEGFVLSRLDAPLSTKELVDLTGLDEVRILAIVETLAAQGAVDVDRDGPAPIAATATTAGSSPSAAPRRETEEEEAQASSPLLDDSPDPDAEPEEESAEEVERQAVGTREYQKIYESLFHPMQRDERLAAAATAEGSNLCALCLDADPQIIHAVLTNPKAGFEHARLVALHHRTHVGLEHVGRRTEFLADSQVQRRLLANPQLPDSLLRRIVSPKLLTEVYKIAINREIPERSRVKTRELLQKRFMLASADERAALLIRTEGRCLVLLVNCALDARTVQMLTAKTTYTLLFIQNLARWSATPPALLAHLLKQPVVRQNIGLRKMLLKHRNVPSELKRQLS